MNDEAIMNEDNIIHLVANGRGDTFYFNFYFFQDADIKVSANGQPVPYGKYYLQKTNAGIAADYPYSGGGITFDSPPPEGTKITIERRLRMERSIDYHPTLQVDPIHLNRDLNFFMECVKEFDRRLLNLQSLEDLDAGEIAEKIEAVNALIASLEDEADSAHEADLGSITEAIAAINAALAALEERISNLPPPPADYIIGTSSAGANAWWRKWSSGWVEQGMPISITSTGGSVFHLPVAMANTTYAVTNSVQSSGVGQGSINVYNKTTSSFTARGFWNNTESGSLAGYVVVSGYAA